MSLTTLGQQNPPDSLLVFDNFRVDKTLPKYQKEVKKKKKDGALYVTSSFSTGTLVVNGSDASFRASGFSWWRRAWLRMTFRSPKSIKYVFNAVLSSPEELSIFEEHNATVQKLIEDATRMGQTTLKKELEATVEVTKFENALVAIEMKRFISEELLLKFVSNCQRGLCLDWVKNFTRVIPEDVAESKLKCDKAQLFDNYVVLHYDPKNRGTSKKDREAAKDPILFGVIRGSRRLYFVGDWIDEYCDLTLQQLVDTMGAEEQTTLPDWETKA